MEPQPGGGDGAVLPHGHRGRSGGERGQGLVTWEDKMDPGLNGVLCSYTQGCPCLCASWNGPAFGQEHGMDSDSFADSFQTLSLCSAEPAPPCAVASVRYPSGFSLVSKQKIQGK